MLGGIICFGGGGVGSLYILLIVVNGGSFGCGFDCFCVISRGRRGLMIEFCGLIFKTIIFIFELFGEFVKRLMFWNLYLGVLN